MRVEATPTCRKKVKQPVPLAFSCWKFQGCRGSPLPKTNPNTSQKALVYDFPVGFWCEVVLGKSIKWSVCRLSSASLRLFQQACAPHSPCCVITTLLDLQLAAVVKQLCDQTCQIASWTVYEKYRTKSICDDFISFRNDSKEHILSVDFVSRQFTCLVRAPRKKGVDLCVWWWCFFSPHFFNSDVIHQGDTYLCSEPWCPLASK